MSLTELIKDLFYKAMRKKPKYLIKESADGQFYFVLVAPNGKVILTSEMYKTKQGCHVGIKSIRKNCWALTYDYTT